MGQAISTAFAKLVALAEHDGIKCAADFPGCWERSVGAHWWIALNAHKEPKSASSPSGASKDAPFTVEPYHCYVEFNGWPAGVLTPYGGCIAAGDAANEDAFIAALNAEIAAAPEHNEPPAK